MIRLIFRIKIMNIFSNIPQEEQQKEWFRLLQPLIEARMLRENPHESALLNGKRWKYFKNIIEIAIKRCDNAQSIFSRKAEIKKDDNPDGIINDMFAELKSNFLFAF